VTSVRAPFRTILLATIFSYAEAGIWNGSSALPP